MNSQPWLLQTAALMLILSGGAPPVSAQTDADPGWPRVFTHDGQELTVYQPQVDYWHGYTNLHFRAAIAVKGVLKEERFGVAEVDAFTITDHASRIVAIAPVQRDLRFAGVAEPDLSRLRQAVETLHPMGQVTTLSLDRVVAYLDPAKEAVQKPIDVSLAPPRIFSSSSPAILVNFLGEPTLQPVATNRTDLFFAVNTNWDLLYDAASQQYYLLDEAGWLISPDMVKGPWKAAPGVPASFNSLPEDGNWAEVRQRMPGKPVKDVPTVFVSTSPAELILTDGPPTYTPVRGTQLLRVNNTESVLFLHSGDGKLYFLVAGRWFRGGSLNGPWSAASADLPADFAKIPDDDPDAFVKASVPGTYEAQDAVLLASIPTTTTVTVTNQINLNINYSGPPQFVTITNTPVQHAVNTPMQVFLVSGKYYCCDQGVWFESATATGPWALCTNVPSAIYTIPPSDPNHNVTYVVVQQATPSTVTYSQTSGYSGEYVAKTGVVMFGVGILVGAAIANNNDHHYYYPPPPCYYSYGCGACYHYGYGGYYSRGGAAYGPYGGASHCASYNPWSGTYSRSSSAYGPYGSAGRSAAYNPYSGNYSGNAYVNTAYGSASRSVSGNVHTGDYARSGSVNTRYGSTSGSATYNRSSGQYSAYANRTSAYGSTSAQRDYNAYTGQSSASRQTTTSRGSVSGAAAYDAQTGARAGAQQVTTDTGSASRAAGYNPTTGQGAAGRTASDQYGSAGAITTTGGNRATAWNTQQGQGAVGRSSSGDVYASNGDTVYKKDSEGNWSQNSGSGWESTNSPQQQAQAQSDARQQSRSTGGGSSQQAAASSASWSQHSQGLQSQAQARQQGNQQAARSSQFRSSSSSWNTRSFGSSSGGGSFGGSRSMGGRSGGRRR